MLNILIWVGVLIASILIIVWISSRANGIGFFQYFKLYGGELAILFIIFVVMIVSIVGGSK